MNQPSDRPLQGTAPRYIETRDGFKRAHLSSREEIRADIKALNEEIEPLTERREGLEQMLLEREQDGIKSLLIEPEKQPRELDLSEEELHEFLEEVSDPMIEGFTPKHRSDLICFINLEINGFDPSPNRIAAEVLGSKPIFGAVVISGWDEEARRPVDLPEGFHEELMLDGGEGR
jgi:hypothetical protein